MGSSHSYNSLAQRTPMLQSSPFCRLFRSTVTPQHIIATVFTLHMDQTSELHISNHHIINEISSLRSHSKSVAHPQSMVDPVYMEFEQVSCSSSSIKLVTPPQSSGGLIHRDPLLIKSVDIIKQVSCSSSSRKSVTHYVNMSKIGL